MNWWENLSDIFSRKQIRSLLESTARLNVWDGAVRSGKTIASMYRWLIYSLRGPKGDLLMAGKTERTLKRNIINPLQQLLGRAVKYNQGVGELYVGKRLIYIVGANDERAEGRIRGLTLAGAYGDELTLWPESFFKMLLSRLSTAGAQFFGTTNPDSPFHWLKTGYLGREGELDLKSWQFEIDDNPFLDRAYVESLKKEYTGLWFKRFILGLWVMAEGAIYDMWDEARHVVDDLLIPRYHTYFAACDYGTSNPCTFGLYGYNSWPGRTDLVREYWFDSREAGRQKTDSQYGDDFGAWLGDIPVSAVYIDPSAASFSLELQRRGYPVRPANNDVLDGIRFVAKALSNGWFRVARSCSNTIKEFSGYVWDPKAQKRGEDAPLKVNDHAMDRDRYALFSHFGGYTDFGVSTAMPRMSQSILRGYR